jgi:hypothetical protein
MSEQQQPNGQAEPRIVIRARLWALMLALMLVCTGMVIGGAVLLFVELGWSWATLLPLSAGYGASVLYRKAETQEQFTYVFFTCILVGSATDVVSHMNLLGHLHTTGDKVLLLIGAAGVGVMRGLAAFMAVSGTVLITMVVQFVRDAIEGRRRARHAV